MEKLFLTNGMFLFMAGLGALAGLLVGGIFFGSDTLALGCVLGSLIAMALEMYLKQMRTEQWRRLGQAFINMAGVGALALPVPDFLHLSILLGVGMLVLAFLLARGMSKGGASEHFVWLFFGALPVISILAYIVWRVLENRKFRQAG